MTKNLSLISLFASISISFSQIPDTLKELNDVVHDRIDDAIGILNPVTASTPAPTATPVSQKKEKGINNSQLLPYDRLFRGNIETKAKLLTTMNVNNDYHDERIEVLLSGIGNSMEPVTVEAYEVWRRPQGSEYAFKGHQIKSDVGAGIFLFEFKRVRRTSAWEEGERKTAAMAGWFVRVIRDQRIVGIFASSSTYERFAENPAVFSGLKIVK